MEWRLELSDNGLVKNGGSRLFFSAGMPKGSGQPNFGLILAEYSTETGSVFKLSFGVLAEMLKHSILA